MRLLLFLIFFSGFLNVKGGNSDITSHLIKLNELKKIHDPIDRDTQLIWQYSFISEELARSLDPRTEAYLDTLRMMCDLTSWDNAMGFYYRAMGRFYDFKGNFSDGLSYYDKAINAFKPAGGDLKELAFTYVLKGFLLSNSEMYQECIKTFEEGIVYATRTDYKNSLCLMLDWFGDYYYYGLEGNIDNHLALDYYLQVNQILPSITYPRIIADNHAVLAGVYFRLGQLSKAANHFPIADSICKAENLLHVRWGLYAENARSLEANKKYREANEVYLTAYEFMKSSPNIEFKSRIEEALWNNYKYLNNHKLALHHYENMIEMEEIMAKEEVQKKYAELESKYELSIKEKEIVELQRTKLASNRNLAIGILILTILSSVIIVRKNNELNNNYKKLEKNQEEVEHAIYLGETQERQRLSAELHDNVNTKLVAAKWQLEAISEDLKDPNKEIVENTIGMLNEAYQDVRNISHNLVPARLESEGLVKSIEDLFQKLNGTQRVKFELSAENLDNEKLEKIIYPLYNIIFELVNNVLKHSNASNANVRISSNHGNLNLTVIDDGKGFDVSKFQPGFGIKSVSNRVKSLKGKLDIASNHEEGTKTSIRIPV